MRTKQYKITLYDADLEVIEKYSKALKMNRSEFIREALRQYDIKAIL